MHPYNAHNCQPWQWDRVPGPNNQREVAAAIQKLGG